MTLKLAGRCGQRPEAPLWTTEWVVPSDIWFFMGLKGAGLLPAGTMRSCGGLFVLPDLCQSNKPRPLTTDEDALVSPGVVWIERT